MLDKLHALVGSQKFLQAVNACEVVMVQLAELSAPDHVAAIELIKSFLDKQKKEHLCHAEPVIETVPGENKPE